MVLKSAATLLAAAGIPIHPAARPAFEAWLTAWPALKTDLTAPAAVVPAAWWGEEARAIAGFAAYAQVLRGAEALAVVRPLSDDEIARVAWAEVYMLLAAVGLAPAVVIGLRERVRRETGSEGALTPALRRKLARQPGPQPAPRPFARAIARFRARRPHDR